MEEIYKDWDVCSENAAEKQLILLCAAWVNKATSGRKKKVIGQNGQV